MAKRKNSPCLMNRNWTGLRGEVMPSAGAAGENAPEMDGEVLSTPLEDTPSEENVYEIPGGSQPCGRGSGRDWILPKTENAVPG